MFAGSAANAVRGFFGDDVPSIFESSAKALRSSTQLLFDDRSTEGDYVRIAAAVSICVFCLSHLIVGLWRFDLAKSKPGSLVSSYWLTRVVLVRGMGFIYFFAFLAAAFQGRALFGSLGLQPIGLPKSAFDRPVPAFELLQVLRGGTPTDDLAIELVSWAGVLLSSLVASGVVTGAMPMAALWAGYLSIVNLGARVIIGYGWEWGCLELGFLVMFLCPIFNLSSSFPEKHPTSKIVLWLMRYFVFRLMVGAGMSKIGKNASACWLKFECTASHYETQPMPSALAWLFHHLPLQVHKLEGRLTFVEQLVMPIFVLSPYRAPQLVVCFLELFFQGALIITGNYAYLNYLAALACFACLDDDILSRVMPASMAKEARRCNEVRHKEAPSSAAAMLRSWQRKAVHLALFFFIIGKSAAPIKELFTPALWLHFYDDYFFVNAHGLFGFINRHCVVPAFSGWLENQDRTLLHAAAQFRYHYTHQLCSGHRLYCCKEEIIAR